jgi:hypothetical protein
MANGAENWCNLIPETNGKTLEEPITLLFNVPMVATFT